MTGGGIVGTFLNANNTRHTGAELGGSYVLTRGLFTASGAGDQLTTRAAYTWWHFVFTDDVRGSTTVGPNALIAKDGNRLPGAPPRQASWSSPRPSPDSRCSDIRSILPTGAIRRAI